MKETTGNLIDMALRGDFDVICHGCNTKNVMGAGIAAQIAERLPEAKQADDACFKQCLEHSVPMLGKISIAHHMSQASGKHVTVFNWYTQVYPGFAGPNDDVFVRTNAIKSCAENTVKLLQTRPGVKVGIPLIGCGLAGLQEVTILPILAEALKDLDCTLVHFAP